MDEFRLDQPIDRRTLLKGAGALGLAGLTAPWSGALAALASTKGGTPVKHVIVDMQENRSFDHYYGFAAFAGGYGVPRGYSQPDGKGGSVSPYHFTSLSTSDIGHSWNATHGEWDAGRMDGFYTTDGINCLGYYTSADLPFYYSLFKTSTLCPTSVVHHSELRARLGRASAGRHLGGHGDPAGVDHGTAAIVSVAKLRLHPHLRRGRGLFRPCRSPTAGRLRPRHPSADLGNLALGEGAPPRRHAVRAQLDPQIHRDQLRAAHTRLGEPSVRRRDIGRRELPGSHTRRVRRATRATSGRAP